MNPGTRFGSYQVVEPLGSGGMGEVYRAHDSKLRRDVALKVLPPDHRLDAERQSRFEREALALATLNHPNIATVHGVENVDGVQALVMELVDGQTLAERIVRTASRLPVSEALAMARQIVDALEAAHERGIIHRDLKPANIKIRPDGVVKVLDFGLAKALQTRRGDSRDATMSRTSELSVVGTPAYMSPEQARGQDVDQRTDIWAFGCVLFEMFARGRRAFDGPTATDVIAAVLNREPDYGQLRADTPPLVRRLVQRCLEKDTRRRLRDIADARLDLDDASGHALSESPARPARRLAALSKWLLVGAAGLVAGAALSFAIGGRRADEAKPERMHLTALLPAGVTVNRGPGRLLPLAVSPDGRTLIIAASDSKGERLYKRTLGEPEATAVPGTDGGIAPFFSPDGASIGFVANHRLMRIPVSGGAAIDIAQAPAFPAGASWGIDDRIIFAGLNTPLQIIDARGGTPQDVLPRGSDYGDHFPDILPNGRAVLFSESGWIHAVDLVSKRRTDRIIEGVCPRYVSDGYLLVTRGTTVLGAPFDVEALKVTGPAVSVVEGVDIERAVNNVPNLAVNRTGTVAFVPSARTYTLALLEPDGRERLLAEQPMLENPRFSPDGARLVVATTRNPTEKSDLWVYDLKSGAPAYRLTVDGGRAPVWSRDGASVTYSYPWGRQRSGIYSKAIDGGGDARRIVAVPTFHWLVGWTPSHTLVYGQMEAPTATNGMSVLSSILSFSNDESRRVVGPAQTWGGRLSPDGRWLVYYTQDAGYFEIFATPLAESGSRSLIAEGTDPSWSPDGSEIYYRNGSRLMAARVDRSKGIRVLSRRIALEPFLPPLYDDYDIHPDGRTLAFVRPSGELRGREIGLLLNWPTTLQQPR